MKEFTQICIKTNWGNAQYSQRKKQLPLQYNDINKITLSHLQLTTITLIELAGEMSQCYSNGWPIQLKLSHRKIS